MTMGHALKKHADAELIELGAQLEAAWAEERRCDPSAREAAYDRSNSIVALIEVIPATTMDGLKVKARAVAWCHAGESKVDLVVDQDTTDLRLASQIINMLAA